MAAALLMLSCAACVTDRPAAEGPAPLARTVPARPACCHPGQETPAPKVGDPVEPYAIAVTEERDRANDKLECCGQAWDGYAARMGAGK